MAGASASRAVPAGGPSSIDVVPLPLLPLRLPLLLPRRQEISGGSKSPQGGPDLIGGHAVQASGRRPCQGLVVLLGRCRRQAHRDQDPQEPC